MRVALALATLLVLALGLAPSAGASVYWSNAVGPTTGTTGTTIGRANNDSTGVNQAFIGGASLPTGVAVDAAHVYWINDLDKSIGRANLDGTGVNQRFITGVTGDSLAVDAGHIYWTDLASVLNVVGTIGRANLDGTGVAQNFIITSADNPSGVAVDGTHVYWTHPSGHTIGRANLDGTGVNQNFLDVGLGGQPFGIAVDAAHIYWTDLLAQAIGRANLDGTALNPNFIEGARFPLAVVVDSAHIYWTDFNIPTSVDGADGAVGRANLDGTGVNQTFITGAREPEGVAVDAATQAAPPSRVSIGDVSMAEGNAGQTAFRFNVTLDRAQSAPVTVDFAAANGTASAPSDYAADTGTVTFAAGETAKTVTVQVNGDTTVEPNETFNVNLANATGNATIADGQAVATIVNDDRRRPRHGFTLGGARLNLKMGTARLAVTVPGPGKLAISGPGVRGARARVARSVRAAGTLRLLIGASGKKQRTLNRTGTVTIRPRVTYTPIGGTPHTRSKSVRLGKRPANAGLFKSG
jgi:hypothetical protein